MTPSTTTSGESQIRGALLFGATIFASAYLIFLVQPMVGKRIVPWFGGTPGTWTLCLAFYQSVLFLGYAYAHFLVARVPPIRQLGIHALLFVLAFALLPVLPGELWKPLESGYPSARILAMLAANVALPFLMLAATGPLLQAWFARLYPGHSPYPLYALSNLGSLLALLSYPFFIEPRLALPLNSDLWSLGFALSGAGVLCCSWMTVRHAPSAAHSGLATSQQTASPQGGAAFRVGALPKVLWILLPACAVVLMMGVTNELCLDVASVPFLWVVPLCIYLLTFILCFASERLYPRGAVVGLGVILLGILVAMGDQSPLGSPGQRNLAPLYSQVVSYAVLLFICCTLLHGELYRLRPPAKSLTAYYLCISGGGAAGGLFVGLLAPRIFTDYAELPLGLAAGWILFLVAWWRDPTSRLLVGGRRWAWMAAACASVAMLLTHVTTWNQREPFVVLQHRNFYGVLRVLTGRTGKSLALQTVLRNGTTGHGMQLVNPDLRSRPTGYFAPPTGIGITLGLRASEKTRTVGVIGLGIGTLAAYGREGDHFRFFEIDPDVVRVARDSGHFSYLTDSEAEIEIIEGDGRLSLESELRARGEGLYDVLVLDAFNSDSIPVHLLTVEAFEIYARHLREGGMLAVHVSSQQLILSPLVHRLGKRVGLDALIVRNSSNSRFYSKPSKWVLLSQEKSTLEDLKARALSHWKRRGLGKGGLEFFNVNKHHLARAPLWTDDYSDLFSVLRYPPF